MATQDEPLVESDSVRERVGRSTADAIERLRASAGPGIDPGLLAEAEEEMRGMAAAIRDEVLAGLDERASASGGGNARTLALGIAIGAGLVFLTGLLIALALVAAYLLQR